MVSCARYTFYFLNVVLRFRIIPFLFSFYFLAYIIEAASILNAISEINLEVVSK